MVNEKIPAGHWMQFAMHMLTILVFISIFAITAKEAIVGTREETTVIATVTVHEHKVEETVIPYGIPGKFISYLPKKTENYIVVIEYEDFKVRYNNRKMYEETESGQEIEVMMITIYKFGEVDREWIEYVNR